MARRLAERFELDLTRSNEITLPSWRRRLLGKRLGEVAAGVCEPWL